MSSNKYIDSLIGLSFIFVIFPVIPMFLRVGFLGGEFSAKASFYTLFICLVYSVWLKGIVYVNTIYIGKNYYI